MEKTMFETVKSVLTATAVATLVACGGGESTSPGANAVIEGVWSGTSSSGYTLNTLALENGSTYVIFGNVVGSTLNVAGFDQGTVVISGSSISSTVSEYMSSGVGSTGTMTGTAVTGTSISGSTAYVGGTTTFNLTPMATSLYNYNTAAANADVVGSWTGSMLNGTGATISVSSGGGVTGSNGGCLFTGTAIPRASGKNVFDVSITFGASPCALPGETATGIAIDYAITGTALKQLLVVVQNSTKANGAMFFAQR